MKAELAKTWHPGGSSDWILSLQYLPNYGSGSFASSCTDGTINVFSLAQASDQPILTIKGAHESSINGMKGFENSLIGSCSTDGLKVWDLRTDCKKPIHSLSNVKNSNFLSLAYGYGQIAGGTELVSPDAEIHIWDLKNPSQAVKSYVDSHHDDITHIEFHPTMNHFLMSGSTDGYANIYDMTQSDEEDALHQVINFGSIHTCHFTQEKRVSVLSHFETLAFYDLNDTNYETDEISTPKDLGDVRRLWPNCEYVVDIYPSGYITFGSNSTNNFTLCPFDPISEIIKTDLSIQFPGAHGSEVVRDTLYLPGTNSILTSGEDGLIKAWNLPRELEYFDQVGNNSAKLELETQHVNQTISQQHFNDVESLNSKVDKVDQHKKDKKDKKHKKSKKDHERRKNKKDSRFKPY